MLHLTATKLAAEGDTIFTALSLNPDGTFCFSTHSIVDSLPPRLMRYEAETGNPKPATWTDLDITNSSFSAGLYAAELLGYAVKKDLVFRRSPNETVFEIRPSQT